MSSVAELQKRARDLFATGLARSVLLLLALFHAGAVLWNPHVYASAIGGFNAGVVPLMIWSICSGVILGVGFQPISGWGKLLLNPYLSLVILLYLLMCYLF